MHKGIRAYRPTPTANGTVCQPSIRRSSAPNTPGGSQRNSPSRADSPTRQMLHHLLAPGVASYAFPDQQLAPTCSSSAAANKHSSAAKSTPSNNSNSSSQSRKRGNTSPSASRNRRGGLSSSSVASSELTGFDYEAEVEKLLANPVPKPLPPPRGAPTFVIVAAANSEDDRGVPVTLAASFDRARAAASGVWRVPSYGAASSSTLPGLEIEQQPLQQTTPIRKQPAGSSSPASLANNRTPKSQKKL